jgi:hypothetical protein
MGKNCLLTLKAEYTQLDLIVLALLGLGLGLGFSLMLCRVAICRRYRTGWMLLLLLLNQNTRLCHIESVRHWQLIVEKK